MELSKNFLGTIRQYKRELDFTDVELEKRAKLYMETCADKFYKGDIVYNSGYGKSRADGYMTSDGKKPFGEVIAKVLIAENFVVPVDKACTYNHKDERKAAMESLKGVYKTIGEMRAYCGKSETRLMHVLAMLERVGNYTVVDYQIPTTNGQKDNVDILLKKDGDFYMTEAKRFLSTESLVRCVLEIQTYYSKLNPRFYEMYECTPDNLKKAVMFDKGSFAYKQLSYPWAKQLLDKFDIRVLILSETKDGYLITEKKI